MRSETTRRINFALVALLTIGLCFVEASAQRKRSKRSRRATNPVTVVPVAQPPQTTEPQIISTADQQASEQNNTPDISGQIPASKRPKSRARSTDVGDEDQIQRTVNDLTNQVTKLSDKINSMEQQQRTLVDLERLSRAEQRAEVLRTQLRDVQEKEGNLMARMEQLNYELKPENIERSVATYGSTRPEDARDARRRALESDKIRTQSQLDLLATSRQRLEAAIVTADLEVDKLRRRIEEATEPPSKPAEPTNSTDSNTEETNSTTQPKSTTNTSTPPE